MSPLLLPSSELQIGGGEGLQVAVVRHREWLRVGTKRFLRCLMHARHRHPSMGLLPSLHGIVWLDRVAEARQDDILYMDGFLEIIVFLGTIVCLLLYAHLPTKNEGHICMLAFV